MSDNVKYVTLRDPITNEILVPRMIGSLGYEVIEGETIPPFAMKNDADTLQGHPADYFAKAGDFSDIANQYVWDKVHRIENAGQGTTYSGHIVTMYNSGKEYDVVYADTISDLLSGITNKISISDYSDGNNFASAIQSKVRGKYFKVEVWELDASGYSNLKLCYMPTDATVSYSSAYRTISASSLINYPNATVIDEHIEYIITSTDAEPVEESYTFIGMGQIGGLGSSGIKIETGSYTGTGTYGESNPNSLTFGFEPKLLIVGTDSGRSDYFIWIYGWSSFAGASESSVHPLALNGNTISWYGSKAQNQYNLSGTKYYYIAIG